MEECVAYREAGSPPMGRRERTDNEKKEGTRHRTGSPSRETPPPTAFVSPNGLHDGLRHPEPAHPAGPTHHLPMAMAVVRSMMRTRVMRSSQPIAVATRPAVVNATGAGTMMTRAPVDPADVAAVVRPGRAAVARTDVASRSIGDATGPLDIDRATRWPVVRPAGHRIRPARRGVVRDPARGRDVAGPP